jgi:hypothetical protein
LRGCCLSLSPSQIVVSDNNFAPAQFTQFLLFSVSDDH